MASQNKIDRSEWILLDSIRSVLMTSQNAHKSPYKKDLLECLSNKTIPLSHVLQHEYFDSKLHDLSEEAAVLAITCGVRNTLISNQPSIYNFFDTPKRPEKRKLDENSPDGFSKNACRKRLFQSEGEELLFDDSFEGNVYRLSVDETSDEEELNQQTSSSNDYFEFLQHFSVKDVLAKSLNSTVFSVESLYDSKPMVAKVIQADSHFRDDCLLPREILMLMNTLDVEGTCKLYRYFEIGHRKIAEDHPSPAVVIVMDKPKEPFQTFRQMVDNASTTEDDKRAVFCILVDILRRLDSKNVAHNDLVEENILVSISSPFQVTLVDFGSARYKTEEFDNALDKNDKNLPPELLERGVFDYDRLTMWSLGKMIQRNVKSTETVDDLLSMLLVPSEYRYTLDQVFDHPYFAIGNDEQ